MGGLFFFKAVDKTIPPYIKCEPKTGDERINKTTQQKAYYMP